VLEELQRLHEKDGFLSQLSSDELSDLAQNSEEVRCAMGEHLIVPGQSRDYLYLVLEGEIAAFVSVAKDDEHILDEIGPGGLAGEMVLFSGGNRTVTVRATQNSCLLRVPLEVFHQLLLSRPELWSYVANLVQARLRRLKLFTYLTKFFGQTGVFEMGFVRELEPQIQWLTLKRGELLFRQDEVADAAYFVITGRLRVVVDDQKSTEKAAGEIVSGEAVGEMALLAETVRSATVYVSRDCELVRMPTVIFDRIVERYPQLLRSLCRVLAERLRRTTAKLPARGKTVCIGLLPADASVPLAEFANDLKEALTAHGLVEVLSSAKIDELIGRSGMAQTRDNDPLFPRLIQWLNEREEGFRCHIYQADATWSPWTQRCVHQADKLFIVAMADSSPLPGEIESSLSEGPDQHLTQDQILTLLHPPDCERPSGTAKWLNLRSVKSHHHICRRNNSHYARLARSIVGESVSLVLGGGVARGFAHIGVIRALEEAGIPIDMIGGTSMGAMIAGQYVCGYDYETMIRINSDVFHRSSRDYTLPLIALLSGAELWRRGSKYVGDVTIEDLWLPYFAVSSNLTKADIEVHRTGSLGWAIRASGSVPGVWPPINHNGELLVDGAVLNNLPIDVMHKCCDGRVIAVDVSAPLDLQENSPYGVSISGWQILWKRITPFVPSLKLPGISDVLMRAAELASVRAQQQAVANDFSGLYLRPPVTQFQSMEFEAIRDIASIGHRYSEGKIEKWRKEMVC
jgi:NTE family protein/lysophospholipid hydrolase